jgi:hypothetical protein
MGTDLGCGMLERASLVVDVEFFGGATLKGSFKANDLEVSESRRRRTVLCLFFFHRNSNTTITHPTTTSLVTVDDMFFLFLFLSFS